MNVTRIIWESVNSRFPNVKPLSMTPVSCQKRPLPGSNRGITGARDGQHPRSKPGALFVLHVEPTRQDVTYYCRRSFLGRCEETSTSPGSRSNLIWKFLRDELKFTRSHRVSTPPVRPVGCPVSHSVPLWPFRTGPTTPTIHLSPHSLFPGPCIPWRRFPGQLVGEVFLVSY